MDTEGFSLRRLNLLKEIIGQISQQTEQIEAITLKENGLNDDDFRFVLDRLFNIGLCYFPDCGTHSIEEYEISIALAKKRFSKPEDKEALENEIKLLIKSVTCMMGNPIKLPQSINFCDKNVWIRDVEKIQESQGGNYITHEDELLYVCEQQRERELI